MHSTSLELLARQLADGLRGDNDAFRRELVRAPCPRASRHAR